MATRSITTVDVEKVMQALREFESTPDSPTTTSEIAEEFGVPETTAFNALVSLEDAGKISGEGRGLTATWWLVVGSEAEAPKPKAKRRTKAQMEEAKAEERNRLEYATRAAESQDEVMSQSPMVVAHAIAAVTPILDDAGEAITVPVSEDSTERRELDASQGERVLFEGTLSEALGTPFPTAAQLLSDTAEDVVLHDPKNGPALDVELPELPEGVNENVWELAHQGNTERARTYWMSVAMADRATWEGENEPISLPSLLTDEERAEVPF